MIIVWRITEQCNLSCPFCAYDRSLGGVRREARVSDVESIAPVLAAYRKQTGKRVLVSWLGGEPLLWPPLFSLSRLLRGHDIEISTTTNGTGLHLPRVREQVLESFSE